MKRILSFAMMLYLAIPSHLFAASVSYDVVPLPNRIVLKNGESFTADASTRVGYPAGNVEMKRNAEFLRDYLRDAVGISFILDSKAKNGAIRLVLDKKINGDEAYTLTVNKKGIVVAGRTPRGVFYGIQTLRKSVSVGKTTQLTFPAVEIADAPRFCYRGMMLDCSRHFFPISFVKKYIDIIAMHNMNTFHWHLSDDQGWRIEIKKYPKLTEIGSKRTGTVLGFNSMADDSTEYGGFYTQEEAREIVRYAAERFITVIPEIDMPGHMKAALTAYPELGCTGGPYEVGHKWGVYLDVLCLGNDKVYKFCEDVLDEIMQIFPAKYIHIGGDETPTVRWEKCPKCQRVMKQHNLKPKTAQGYFTNRIEKYVLSKGHSIIGWDEILDGDIDKSATIMSWRGTGDAGLKATENGHDIIMSPTSCCYFNFCQSKNGPMHEPTWCDGFIDTEKVYNFEPCPDSLSARAKSRILGVQANLWTEYITCPEVVEYMLLPRMAALADVQWSTGMKDFAAFRKRLDRFTSFYDLYYLNYAKHLWPEKMVSPWKDIE